QGIRDLPARLRARVLLGGWSRIALDPASRPFAHPRLGGGYELGVLASELHANSHLLVRDVSSGHEGVLVLVVEEPTRPAHAATNRRGLQPPPPVGSGTTVGLRPPFGPTRPAIRSCRSPAISAVATQFPPATRGPPVCEPTM